MRVWRTIVAVTAVLLAVAIGLHGLVPNAGPRLGSLIETFLPWLGLGVPVVLVLALTARSRIVVLTAVLPLAAWLIVCGGKLLPGRDAPHDLTVVQHNLSDENPDPAGTARALMAARPDLIGVEELLPENVAAYQAVFAAEYPYRAVHGTVGLWSRFPIAESRLVDLRPSDVDDPEWNRGLRAVVGTPRGDVAVYVAHLPSLRLGAGGFGSERRDESATFLGNALAREPLDRIVLIGDLNGTTDDRGLRPIRAVVTTTGRGFAFSWPAGTPIARIDQIMARSLTVTRIWTLDRTGSDHLPIAARLRF
ncbi:endonuclease/exonuclease/phosphatase family protein [Catenuloplanes atrovinosus]|uniref:Vancomycin resistance protein VanJ n=1 Tax=Catenuloplanes atrovinosus TaxID=137266 RepID=A0AAE3YN90_9ACTN|nr:endonuclease/exonuclease/phosphatase family protein [Catenuloplanes atrovinosus]MDR7276650.1 vancomycin resistance protein VanJ [Catenuloplanes atrovinosus]